MEKIFAILGVFIFVGAGYLLSKDKKNINWRSVWCAFIGQFVLGFLLIKTPLWKVVEIISSGFEWLLNQSVEGINFVFGGLSNEFVFFLNALLPIIFISSIMGILFHFNIIQKFIAVVGKLVAKILRVDTLVAVNGVTNMFMGQSESLFVTKSYLPNATDSVIFATLVGGMTSISVSVVGMYASFGAKMEWIIISMPLTVLSTFVLTQIIMPSKYSEEEIIIEDDKGINVIETMMTYAMTAAKSIAGIAVALMVFLSIVFMINNLLALISPSLTIQGILGIVFYPIGVLMGVPAQEIGTVSQILATKLTLNEAVAFALPQFTMLTESTKAIMTIALCGFAGIGSIAIMIGGYSAIAPNKVKTVAKFGMLALITATIVNCLTGAVVAILL